MNVRKKIVRLTGGIGNQLFQYAFARSLEIEKNCEVEFDTSFYKTVNDRTIGLNLFNIANRVFCIHPIYDRMRLFVQRIPFIRWIFGCYKERSEFEVDHRVKQFDYKFYSGYWQNRFYFDKYADLLHIELKYNGNVSEKTRITMNKISSDNAIAVHVRRGDYLIDTNKDIYVSLGVNYYLRAIEMAKNAFGIDNLNFYFFSDDLDWCRKEFGFIDGAVFIDDKNSDSQYTDLLLMEEAHCLIMANSTFSWWAAWLSSRRDKIVIAPKHWYKNKHTNDKVVKALLCDNWIICE